MEKFASLAMLITLVVTLVVGGRLLAVARRTHELPELLFGIGFVAGGLGQAFGQLGQRVLWTTSGPFASSMNALMFALVLIGSGALFIVIWQIYRPGFTFGAWICAAAIPLLCLSWALRFFLGDFANGSIGSSGMLLHQMLRACLFSWASIESIRYYGLLKKRLALGLADPVAMNQILLWGMAGIGMVGLNFVISWNVFLLGRHPLADPFSTAFILVFMSIVSCCMWCAFFPPAGLRQWLVARAAKAAQ